MIAEHSIIQYLPYNHLLKYEEFLYNKEVRIMHILIQENFKNQN